MKKYILKYLVAFNVLAIAPNITIRGENQIEQKQIDFLNTVIKNTADFVDFSTNWTTEFFDTKNGQAFATFAKQLTEATAKFNSIVVEPVCDNLHRGSTNSHYQEALRIGKEIVCMLHNQASHIASILNKHLHSRSVVKVGWDLEEANKYIKTKMIHELETKFNQFASALRKVDSTVAAHAQAVGNAVIQARREQHEIHTAHKMRALHHRLKC